VSWEQIGAIGQVAATVGLIPSLIYLAIQVPGTGPIVVFRSTCTARSKSSSSARSTTTPTSGRSTCVASTSESLDPVSRLQFGAYLLRVFTTRTAPCRQRPRTPSEGKIQDVIAYPGVQAWWATRRDWYADASNELVTTGYVCAGAKCILSLQRADGTRRSRLTRRSIRFRSTDQIHPGVWALHTDKESFSVEPAKDWCIV